MTQPSTSAPKIPRYLSEGEQRALRQSIADSRKAEKFADGVGRSEAIARSELAEGQRKAERMLSEQMPPDTSPAERDRLNARIKRNEEILKEGIPSDETMRRNPNGAVDRHIQWERRVHQEDGLTNKQRFAMYRADTKTLHKNTYDPAHLDAMCELDRLRPATDPQNYHDAQIPRSSVFVQMPGDSSHPNAMDWDSFLDSSPNRSREALEAKEAELQAMRDEKTRLAEEVERLKNRSNGQGNRNPNKR